MTIMKQFTRPIFSQILLAIIAAALVGVWSFLYVRAADLRVQHKTSSEILVKEQERVKNIQSLRDLIKSTSEDRAKLASIFVYEDNVITFLDRVEYVAAYAGLSFEVSNAQVTEKGLVLTTQATGSFEDTLYLLELLEHLPYQLSVLSVETRNPNPAERVWTTNLTMQLSSFIAKDKSVSK